MFELIKKINEIFIFINKLFDFDFNFDGFLKSEEFKPLNVLKGRQIDFGQLNKINEPFILLDKINSFNEFGFNFEKLFSKERLILNKENIFKHYRIQDNDTYFDKSDGQNYVPNQDSDAYFPPVFKKNILTGTGDKIYKNETRKQNFNNTLFYQPHQNILPHKNIFINKMQNDTANIDSIGEILAAEIVSAGKNRSVAKNY